MDCKRVIGRVFKAKEMFLNISVSLSLLKYDVQPVYLTMKK